MGCDSIMSCPVCNSTNFIKLNLELEETDIAWDGKIHFPKHITILFCMDCNNIFGEKS